MVRQLNDNVNGGVYTVSVRGERDVRPSDKRCLVVEVAEVVESGEFEGGDIVGKGSLLVIEEPGGELHTFLGS